MGKTIILIHGRSFKPAEDQLKALWLEALIFGIERDHADKLDDFKAATVDFVYFGDISNEFLESFSQRPDNDLEDRKASLEQLKQFNKNQFTKANYDALPGFVSWKEALADSLSDFVDFIGLAQPVIGAVAPDMKEYWNEGTSFGSYLRETMTLPLKRAMNREDEILVISHSLGTLIAYDTFWKFSRTGEYRPKYSDKKVDIWVTLGSPLGNVTVQRNLKGVGAKPPRKYPGNIKQWINIAAEDDYVCHDQNVADDFDEMHQYGLLDAKIEDHRIYSLAVRHGTPNPHSSVGYLIHPLMAEIVAKWV